MKLLRALPAVPRLRDAAALALTGAVAVGVPALAAAWVGHRTDALVARVSALAGVDARIGAIDADLTGTIRLSDVALGELVAADQIEASVALDSLLAGDLGADEIAVASPRVAIRIDADGDSDLARLARRILDHMHRGPSPHGGGHGRLRRIVVSAGSLTAQLAGIGELSADGVELVPDAGGVRVLTGHVHVVGAAGPFDLHSASPSGDAERSGGAGPFVATLDLARSAAELALPRMRVGRALAVAGTGTLMIGDRQVAVRDVAIGRLRAGGALELHGAIDDGGIAREVSAEVTAGPSASAVVRGDHVPLAAIAALAPHGIELGSAHASGEVAVKRLGGTLHVAIDGRVDGATIDHRALAADPVPVDGTLRGAIDITSDAVTVNDLQIGTGAAHATATGWLRRLAPIAGELDVAIAPAPCADLLASLPLPLRGPLDGLVLTGTVGAHARIAIDLAASEGEGVDLTTGLTGGCSALAEPPAADASVLLTATEHTFPDGTRTKVGRGQPGWTGIGGLPRHVGGAFVAAEDAAFWEHHGFDLHQIARSLEIDLREHKLVRGGSTISQQLIKNAFLSQRRSLDRKLQEAILTWRLESRLDKHQILERYLNIIELGPGVYGIGAAAQHWFGEPAHELTVHQAAFLAAMTSEPQSMSRRIHRAGGLDPDSATRVEVVLLNMRRDEIIDDAQLADAHETPLTFIPSAMKN